MKPDDVGFVRNGQSGLAHIKNPLQLAFDFEGMGKPAIIVIQPSIVPEDEAAIFDYIKHFAVAKRPVFFSFASAATARL
jgi:hypothetical protein